jgi:tRNA wybutosine-synthesizing protein 4
VAGIRKVVSEFFRCCEVAGLSNPQIVNLGAGLDSLSFWILDKFPHASIFEVDHPEIVDKKKRLIAQTPQLRASPLQLIGADLRLLQRLKETLIAAGLDATAPTLFIAECVLIYMDASFSDALLKWTTEATSAAPITVCAIYEQTNPNDAFGRVMTKALAERGCPLLGISAYPTLEDQHGRFIKAGFEQVDVATMNKIFDECIDKDELNRIKKLELFDEFEEWRLMQAHYFIAVGTRCSKDEDKIRTAFASLANIWSLH